MKNTKKTTEKPPKGWGWTLIFKVISYAITALAGVLTGNNL